VAKIEMVRFELEKTWVNFFKFFPCVSKLVKIDCALSVCLKIHFILPSSLTISCLREIFRCRLLTKTEKNFPN